MMMPRLGHGIAAACLFAAVQPVFAETFTLKNGDVIDGVVIRSLGNTLSIKNTGAGMLQTPISTVRQVDIATKDGSVISGRLTGWANGVYRVSTDSGTFEVSVDEGVVATLEEDAAEDTRETAATAPVEAVAAPRVDAVAAPARSLVKAGFIYVGSADDGGRNFTHERGRQALEETPLVDETTFLEIASEDDGQVTGAVDQLVADGASIIFMTGRDSAAAVVESAKQHEEVQFIHCGSFDPVANVEVFCGRIYQARYLSGIIAGGMTKSGLIGYVAAEPTPETIVGVNAFALGVQSVNPDAKIITHWTKSWYAPGDERKRALELVERGVDILTVHQDSPAAIQVAEQNGIGAIGYQSDMSVFAPSSILTSAVWNWGEMYGQIVNSLNDDDVQLRPT
ncbi:MAG: BMP family ABC transporter substrate-binding protein, partial [Geminicoccaceae bacterium]